MTDHITPRGNSFFAAALAPETDAKLDSDPHPPSDSHDYVRALEIHIHLLRAELADERAKKSDALIAAVNDIARITAERDDAAALARNYAERMARSDAELAAEQQTVARLRGALRAIHIATCVAAK